MVLLSMQRYRFLASLLAVPFLLSVLVGVTVNYEISSFLLELLILVFLPLMLCAVFYCLVGYIGRKVKEKTLYLKISKDGLHAYASEFSSFYHLSLSTGIKNNIELLFLGAKSIIDSYEVIDFIRVKPQLEVSVDWEINDDERKLLISTFLDSGAYAVDIK